MYSIFLVFEYFENDLGSLLDRMKRPFSESEIKCILNQLLLGVEFLHKNFIIHRDIKLSNLLMNNLGNIVLADFGLAREYSHPLESHTSKVVTLWYRAPELIFGSKKYHSSIDIWSIGCIFGELLLHYPLFPANNEFELLEMIYNFLGSINNDLWPGFTRLTFIKSSKFDIIFNKFNQKCTNNNFIPEINFKFKNYKNNYLLLDLLKKLLFYDPFDKN